MSRRAFTLIEILVVIAIITILTGMAMPLLSVARTSAARKNTQSLLAKVETGLGLFKADMNVHPYAAHAPAAATFPAADNRLGWRLAHAMTTAERADLNDDLAVVRAAYGPGGAQAVLTAAVDPLVGSSQYLHAGVANRLATERATLAVLAGNTGITGLKNHPGMAVLPAAKSQGYADDYISHDLAREDLQGDVVVDRYHKPLVYICPVIPAMREIYPADHSRPLRVDYYGLGASGRTPTRSLASDMRTCAPERLCLGFELISQGEDGAIDPSRGHPANRDNISNGIVRGELE